MELGVVVASAKDLIALVDCKLWCLSCELEDFQAFFGAELAISGAKGFDTRYGVSLPENFCFEVNVLNNFVRWSPRWDEL